MKSLALFALVAALALPMAACNREVAHTETTRQTWDGGVRHDETTVTEDANGRYTVERKKEVQH